MALKGERSDRATYTGLTLMPDGSNQLVRCSHVILGVNCVQKTVPIGADDRAFAEPRLLEALDHPRIPPIREAQFDPERSHCVTFVMPWFEGGSVARALLEGHRFSLLEAMSITRDVLDALDYLHTTHDHVHRDVKTPNVLLDLDRRTGWLTDFEHAGSMGGGGSAPAMLTTVMYLPPEAATTGRHDPRSDVYGAGMVLFELLNGRLPWEDFDPALLERRVRGGRRAVVDARLAPAAFAPHVPRDLVRLTRRAIAADPASRFQSAREMIDALNRVMTVDWRQTGDDEDQREWVGTWPPRAPILRRDRYRVTARRLTRGGSAGRMRFVAEVQRPGTITWRRFGVPDYTASTTEEDAARQFMSDVSARVRQRRAAR